MWDCKIEWRKDPDVDGTHNRVPFTCADYISQLETALLKAAVELGTDSIRGREALKALRTPPQGALQVSPEGKVTGIRVTTFGISRDITYPESFTGG